MRVPAIFAGLSLTALLSLAPAAPSVAQSNDNNNRHVVLRNFTSQAVFRVYASNTGATSWQEDMLGDRVVLPGNSIDLNIDDGTGYCRYDLKAVMRDGTVVTRMNVNVCSVNTWTITD